MPAPAKLPDASPLRGTCVRPAMSVNKKRLRTYFSSSKTAHAITCPVTRPAEGEEEEAMSRTNDEWEAAIEAKIAEVVADSSLTNYASGITTADNGFALTIDHTLLKPDATPSQVDTLCDEAIRYGFKVLGRPSPPPSSTLFLFFLSVSAFF